MSVTKVAKFTARGARRKILRKYSPHMRFPCQKWPGGHRNHELEGPFRARAVALVGGMVGGAGARREAAAEQPPLPGGQNSGYQ